MQLQMDKEKVTGGIRARRVVANIVLILLCALCLFWFYILFINSTYSNAQLSGGRFHILPGLNFFTNFKNLMGSSINIWRGMLNSVIIAGATAVLSTYFSSMTAYAIHCYDFKLKNVAFTFILMIMTIPTQVTALGFVQFMRNIRLHDTFIPLMLPAIAAPVTFFYMKQYMDSTLPLSIIEAARIDGSGEFRTFNTIVLPMMKPAIAVQAIFTFVGSWNNYFTPALILKSDKNKTLPILIATLRSADYMKFDMGQVYMMIMLSIFPVIVVYLLLSKYIVGGVALGAVKG
ncbi:MAG: carbohydrate ABC transporter permease [Lachnospiraceae bacterium]|nr:carbohydrate ABC transporter permease [Lachnospiraceae bacterium]